MSSHGKPAGAALACFVAVLVIAAGASAVVRNHQLNVAQARFDRQAASLTGRVQRELAVYSQTLRAASSFLATSTASGTQVDANAWRRYVRRLYFSETLPAMRAFGYAEASGAANATVPSAAPEAPPFAAVTLLWPGTGGTASPVWDLGANDAARIALKRAADTAQVALNVRAAPLESEGDIHAAANLYLAVYRDARDPADTSSALALRTALTGFVFAQIDMDALVANVAAEEPHFDLRVTADTAGNAGTVLYPMGHTVDDTPRSAVVFHHTDTLHFGGEALTLAYATSTPSFSAAAEESADAILAGGALAALVAAMAVFLSLRMRGMRPADARPTHARSTLDDERTMAIIRSSMEAVISVDEAQRVVIFNPMAERVFGVSAMDAIGTSLDRFIPERYRVAHRRHVEQFGMTGVTERQMGRQQPVLFGVRANGDEFPIEASISQIRDASGKLYTVMLRDVTERMRAEDALKTSREELRELSANLQNVREEEKTRIARELHDDLGQQLTALKMDLSSVEQTLELERVATPPELHARLKGMRRLIDTTVASVRRIAADLRPVMLDDLGLVPAIEWLASDFESRYGIEVERRIEPGRTSFTRSSATTLFRIVQEALTNVARHAEATKVTIELAVDAERCILRIADNGRGAADRGARHDTKSFGLLGIRERAHMLGGTVAIESSEQHGFMIAVQFPLAAIQQEETLP